MSPIRPLAWALAAALLTASWGAPGAAAKEQTVKLKLRYEDEKKRLFVPFERRRMLAEKGVDLPVGGRGRLACEVVDRDLIKVDIEGEGTFTQDLGRDAILRLEIQGPGGKGQKHAIRMVNDVYWRPCLEPACARVGKLKSTRIVVVDANLNGKYADYGEDLMVVGKGLQAFPLSRMVVAGRALFRIAVAEDGATLKAFPLEQPLTKLDYASKLKGLEKKPQLAVFRRTEESRSSYVAASKSPALLPAGSWTLAYAVLDDDLWAIGGKDTQPIEVGAEAAKWAWGAPFTLAGKAVVKDQGTHRSVQPAGVLKAPKLIETTVRGKHIVCDFPPTIVGSQGVRFVGSWQNEGEGGVSHGDKRIAFFEVEIAQEGKRLNTDMPRWAPYDMSGLVKKVRKFWTSYEWPVGSLRGRFSLVFRCKSPLFGKDLHSEPLDVLVR